MRALILLALLSTTAYADDRVEVKFENTIETCLSAEVLWQQLSESMVDSGNSWLWPERLSNVSGEGMLDRAIIEVTYKSIFSDVTYSYELSDIVSGQEFTYTAVPSRHPFEGGARVWIESTSNARFFHWEGSYLTPRGASLQRRFFRNYSRSFFRSIEDKIRKEERHYCAN